MDSVDEGDDRKLLSGRCPRLRLRLLRRQENNKGALSNAEKILMRSSSDISSRRRTSLEEMASTSGNCSDNLVEEYVGHNGSLLSLQPWIFKREKYKKMEEDDSDASGPWSYDLSGFSPTLHGSPRRINPGRKRRISENMQEYRYTFRPVKFTGNFFMPHFYNKNAGIEQCTFSSFPCSPVTNRRRPFFIDRSRKSTRDGDSLGECPRSKYYKRSLSDLSSQGMVFNKIGTAVTGEMDFIAVPHLPLPTLRKENIRNGDAKTEAIGASCSQKVCKIYDPQGSFDGMLFFILGVTIGVMSSILSNNMAVEKLNKCIEHNNCLVQDLHEDLEKKDSPSTKELTLGTYSNQESSNASTSIDDLQRKSLSWHSASIAMGDCGNACLAKVGDNPEALSEIEAELEAELERLEQHMNSSCTGQRTSDLTKIDSELTARIVHGELRDDLLNKGGSACQSSRSKKDTANNSTAEAYNANYSVSPKELSLRLHEVIESRLEERIKELESALEQSQVKLQLREVEKLSSKQAFSSSETGSLNCDSPTPLHKKYDNPSCLNLAGDALNAYNDAYEEFMRLTESEDEKLPSSTGTGETLLLKSDLMAEKEQPWQHILWDTSAADEEDVFVDKEGKELIQKIVEKTKQGSPALINAQRMFFLMDF